MHKWIGRHAYAGVYEVTPGTDGRGHVHAHVLLVWPRWLDYGRVRSLWLAASRGSSTRIDIRGIDCDARRATAYVCKYMSKGSEALAPDLAGRVIAAFYGRRAITASRRFWLPTCGCRTCGERVRRDPDPFDLADQLREATRRGIVAAWERMPGPEPGQSDARTG